MRTFNPLASWRWCLLSVLVVGCAHSGASTTASTAAAEPPRSAPASEAPPSEATASVGKAQKVRRLMALTGAEATGQQMLGMMTEHFGRMPNIPKGFLEKFRELAAEQSIVDMLVPVYMKHFSEEDLDAAIAFHESPAGKRFLAAQPMLLQEAKQVGEQWGVSLAEQALRELAEEEQQPRPASHEGQQL